MHFLSVLSVPVLPLPVVIAGKQQPRDQHVSPIPSHAVFAAVKRAVSDRQVFVAIFASGETSCQ
jgi:hypothetical protein